MSISFGKSRILGNTIGGGLAIVYFLLSSASGHSFAVEVVALPILVILCIVFSNGIKNNNGIIASLAALLMISLNIPGNETLSYAFERVLDTFIGTFVAILMNVTLKRAPKKEEESIDREIERLKEEEKTLRKARKLLEGKVQEGE
jgi:uncharacterized membrane protein YgaE (UPF0421/DUF939 family)